MPIMVKIRSIPAIQTRKLCNQLLCDSRDAGWIFYIFSSGEGIPGFARVVASRCLLRHPEMMI
jgi:hypothetical protein